MAKRFLAALLALTLALTMTACGNSKEKEEEEKLKQEQEQAEQKEAADREASDAVISQIDALPEKVKLSDRSAVKTAREALAALTEEQRDLVPEETIGKLEKAEDRIQRLRKRAKQVKKKKAENRKAAQAVTSAIEALPQKVTLNDRNAVAGARSAYNNLTTTQKRYVADSTLSKLTDAESRIAKLDKKAQKKAQKKAEKKAKKQKKTSSKYDIARKYIGKSAKSLIAAIGAPKKKKKNPNCATDGEAFTYIYDGFYVGVQSDTMDSPLYVLNVEKN